MIHPYKRDYENHSNKQLKEEQQIWERKKIISKFKALKRQDLYKWQDNKLFIQFLIIIVEKKEILKPSQSLFFLYVNVFFFSKPQSIYFKIDNLYKQEESLE